MRRAPAWATMKRPGSRRRCAGSLARPWVRAAAYFSTCFAGSNGAGAVVDAEAAAGVDVADVVAVFAQVGDETGDAGERGGEGIDFADLRADVDGDAGGVEPL